MLCLVYNMTYKRLSETDLRASNFKRGLEVEIYPTLLDALRDGLPDRRTATDGTTDASGTTTGVIGCVGTSHEMTGFAGRGKTSGVGKGDDVPTVVGSTVVCPFISTPGAPRVNVSSASFVGLELLCCESELIMERGIAPLICCSSSLKDPAVLTRFSAHSSA